jgi:hypothetical protein
MFRVVALMLALAVGFDLFMLNGFYTTVAKQIALSILRHAHLL